MSGRGLTGTVIVFFALLFVYSKWGPAIPFSTLTQSRGEPMVVSGEGKSFVTPDIAKVSAGIQENGSSLANIQDSVNKKSKSLTDALKKLGIDEGDIKTTSYNLSPQYDFSNPSPRITGYQVSTSYEITIRDFDKVNDVITAVTNSGANLIGNVNFEVNDKTKNEKLNEARKMAVEDAKTKAKGLADSAGITLGRIINISENQLNSPRPIPLAGGTNAVAEKSIAQPDIQPGTTEIDVTVSLSLEIR